MDTPDLIIPIRMDLKGATAALAKVSAAGKKTGDDVDAGAKKGKKGLQDLEGGAGSATKSLLDLGRAQLSFSAMRSAGSAVGEEFKRAADYVKNLAMEFADLRQKMQQVAALKGQGNENEFVLGEVEKVTKAGLKPDQWRQFQEQFQSCAGAQIEGPSAKLTPDQAEEYQQRIAAFMTSRGVEPALGASLGGALPTNAKGPQTIDAMMAQFGRVYQTLEKAQTPVPQLLPQFQETMANGLSPEESAQALAIVGPAGLGEKATSTRGAVTAIRKMKIAGTGAEFGVNNGMSKWESIKAFAKNIQGRREKMLAEGKTAEEVEGLIAKELDEKNLVNDIREARGFIAGFAKQVVDLGAFDTFERYAPQTPDTFTSDVVDAERKTAAGRSPQWAVDEALAKARVGERNHQVLEELEKARTKVVESRELEQPGFDKLARGAFGTSTKVDAEQQMINRQALESVSGRAIRAGVATDNPDTVMGQAEIATETATQDQLLINKKIAALLEKIEANTKKEKEGADKPAGRGPKPPGEPGKPLTAPPAGGAGARQ